MYGQEIQVEALDSLGIPSNPDFAYAVDLFNNGYYWESHVWWEELWHLAGRKGPIADLLKALIKFAAAGVKMELGQKPPAIGHIERGLELIEALLNNSFQIDGVDLNELYTTLLLCRDEKISLSEVKIDIKK